MRPKVGRDCYDKHVVACPPNHYYHLGFETCMEVCSSGGISIPRLWSGSMCMVPTTAAPPVPATTVPPTTVPPLPPPAPAPAPLLVAPPPPPPAPAPVVPIVPAVVIPAPAPAA